MGEKRCPVFDDILKKSSKSFSTNSFGKFIMPKQKAKNTHNVGLFLGTGQGLKCSNRSLSFRSITDFFGSCHFFLGHPVWILEALLCIALDFTLHSLRLEDLDSSKFC